MRMLMHQDGRAAVRPERHRLSQDSRDTGPVVGVSAHQHRLRNATGGLTWACADSEAVNRFVLKDLTKNVNIRKWREKNKMELLPKI